MLSEPAPLLVIAFVVMALCAGSYGKEYAIKNQCDDTGYARLFGETYPCHKSEKHDEQ